MLYTKKKNTPTFSFKLMLFIGSNLQSILSLLVILFSFILSFTLNVAQAGTIASKLSPEDAEVLNKAIIEFKLHTLEHCGNPNAWIAGARKFDFSGLPVRITQNEAVFNETLALSNLLGSIEPGLTLKYACLVHNFMGSESLDFISSDTTLKYDLDSFLKYLNHSVKKDHPIIAKINNIWYLFIFDQLANLKAVALPLTEVANILEALDNGVLNYKVSDSLNTGSTKYSIYDLIGQVWRRNHVNFNEVTSISITDVFLIFENSKGELIKRLVENKVILNNDNFESTVSDYINARPHVAYHVTRFLNDLLVANYIEPFNNLSQIQGSPEFLEQLLNDMHKMRRDAFLAERNIATFKQLVLNKPGNPTFTLYAPHTFRPIHHSIALDITTQAIKNLGKLLLKH